MRSASHLLLQEVPVSVLRHGARLIVRAGVACAFAVAIALVGAIWVLPRATSVQTLTVLTGSMDPAIPQGSLVFVRPVDPRSLQVGDVITFHPNQQTRAVVTHRITGIARDTGNELVLRTKGDNNRSEDPKAITADAVVGRVAFDVPFVGSLSQYASTPRGSLIVIGIPLLIFVGANVHTLVTETLAWRRRRRSSGVAHARHLRTDKEALADA